MALKKTSRAEAVELGLMYYYTGRPCSHRHLSKRRTANNACMACSKERLKKWRKTETGRKSRRLEARKRRERVDVRKPSTKASRARRNAKSKQHYRNNILKVRARTRVRDALAFGQLKKRPCKCGEIKVQAYHNDYTRPLKVKWLCTKCHGKLHRRD